MYFLFFSIMQKVMNQWDMFCEKHRLFGHWAPRVGDKVITCFNVVETVTSVDIKQGIATTPTKEHRYRHCLSPFNGNIDN